MTDAERLEGTLWSLLRSAVSDGVAAAVAGTHPTYEAMAAHMDGLARDRLTDPRALEILARVPAAPTGAEREALKVIAGFLASPYGCAFCDSGKLRSPDREDRQHDEECPYLRGVNLLNLRAPLIRAAQEPTDGRTDANRE